MRAYWAKDDGATQAQEARDQQGDARFAIAQNTHDDVRAEYPRVGDAHNDDCPERHFGQERGGAGLFHLTDEEEEGGELEDRGEGRICQAIGSAGEDGAEKRTPQVGMVMDLRERAHSQLIDLRQKSSMRTPLPLSNPTATPHWSATMTPPRPEPTSQYSGGLGREARRPVGCETSRSYRSRSCGVVPAGSGGTVMYTKIGHDVAVRAA